MTLQDCIAIVVDAYKEFTPQIPDQVSVDSETRLIGQGARLDSAGLVSMLVEVEQQVSDKTGLEIVLADERAMSQQRSPFRSVGTLAEYLLILINEKQS